MIIYPQLTVTKRYRVCLFRNAVLVPSDVFNIFFCLLLYHIEFSVINWPLNQQQTYWSVVQFKTFNDEQQAASKSRWKTSLTLSCLGFTKCIKDNIISICFLIPYVQGGVKRVWYSFIPLNPCLEEFAMTWPSWVLLASCGFAHQRQKGEKGWNHQEHLSTRFMAPWWLLEVRFKLWSKM